MLVEEPNLDLDQFPDSPYASELRRGVSTRSFATEIERSFTLRHLKLVRPRTRLWFTATFLAAVVVSLLQINESGLFRINTWLVMVPHLGMALLLLIMVWSPWYTRGFMKVAAITVPLSQIIITWYLVEVMANNQPQALGGLVLNVFAVFFFAGLHFRFALASGLAVLVGFIIGSYSLSLAPGIAIPSFSVLTAAVFFSAIVKRGIEVAYRTTFLESALIRDLAARDGLTGIFNRRTFEEHLHRTWLQALRDKREIAIVMIDIDHFKSFNDFRGHQAGDLALRVVAQTVQQFARRPFDLAARYGGEEFVVLLYDLSYENVAAIGEQLRQAVADQRIQHGAKEATPVVTISIGVGVIRPLLGRTPKGALQLADEALYAAKEAGRNQMVIAGAGEYQNLDTGSFSSPTTMRIRS